MSDPPPTGTRPSGASPMARLLGRGLRSLQRGAATAVGIDRDAREDTVAEMLAFNARRAPGYWIQLSLAAGIATLGLVLGSTAVVIGAMLVSPLMGPIVELGMGFAVGSSFLVIRSAMRVVLSTVVVVIGTALFTMALPFHEVTSEISARTAPTVLDLLVAAFCALTAAYTTVRRTSDTTSAAAGTAIGIALVPPLCVIGYGIGTGDAHVTSGSALLFTANFSAILLLAVLAFLLLGYNQVDAAHLEQRIFTVRTTRLDRLAERAERWLERSFASRYGMLARLSVPLLILIAVYVPLSTALDRVTWEITARNAVQRILAAEVPGAVQRSVTIEPGNVRVRLIVIGVATEALDLEQRLTTALAAATGVTPTVSVLAIANAEAVQLVPTSSVADAAAEAEVPQLEVLRARLGGELARLWPTAASGRLLGWTIQIPVMGPPTVSAYHFGTPLGAAGRVLLATAVTPALGITPQLLDVVLDSLPLEAGIRTDPWLASVREVTAGVPRLQGASLCFTGPVSDSGGPMPPAIRAAVTGTPAFRWAPSGRWSFQWATDGCAPLNTPASP